MEATRSKRRAPIAAVLALSLLGAYFIGTHSVHAASSLPADKMTATAGDTMVTAPGGTLTIMTAQMKTSTVADLVLSVTSECTILSNISNMGTSTSAYSTIVRVWVELDGVAVPVVPAVTTNGASGGSGGTDDGKVVFCNRELTRSTTFQSNSESIKDVETTETANAFNWIAPNVGNGIHNIAVKANFENTNSGDAMSHGVISRRSLVVNTTNYLISQQP